MKINFYANLRTLVGSKTIEVDPAAGTMVRGLLEEVIERFPALQARLLDEQGGLFPHVHVFINGQDVLFLPNKMDTVLTADDKLDIFPPVAGG